MAEDSLITEELNNQIGVESKPHMYEIEKGLLRQFARAIDDPNPLWHNEEYAKKTRYGTIIAPPSLIIGLGMEDFDADRWHGEAAVRKQCGETELLAGTEIECYQPIKLGDVITVTNKLIDVYEKESKKVGKMLFLTYARIGKNRRQEIVVEQRETFIQYKGIEVKRD